MDVRVRRLLERAVCIETGRDLDSFEIRETNHVGTHMWCLIEPLPPIKALVLVAPWYWRTLKWLLGPRSWILRHFEVPRTVPMEHENSRGSCGWNLLCSSVPIR